MDLVNSQETEIINEGDLNYIINDLGPSQQFMFLQGNEYTDDINSNQQQHHQSSVVLGGGEEAQMQPTPPPTPVPAHTSPTGLQPCLTKYSGVYNFTVEIAGTPNGRHAWVYSSKLQKIFIDIDKVLLFQFKLNTVDVKGLWVRALLVYSDPDNASLAVNRCTLHAFKCDPNRFAHANERVCQCTSYNLCGHVVTSGHPCAQYDFNAQSGRHSVVVPLAAEGGYAAGQDATTVAYQFGCKTSCASGMSRRPVTLLFTLETQFGEVVGRSTMPVKICSCPKRDKDREESGELDPSNADRTSAKLQLHPSKKRKMQHQHKSTLTPLEPAATETNQLSGISILYEEMHKLNAKVDQLSNKMDEEGHKLNAKIDYILSYLHDIAPRLQDNKFQAQ